MFIHKKKAPIDYSSYMGNITRLPPDDGLALRAWLDDKQRQASFNNRGGKTCKRSKSPFFKRGQGSV